MNSKMICPIIFNTHVEADIVLDKLDEKIQQYGLVAVADLYELVGLNKEESDYSYGWTDLRKSEVASVKGGYELRFPNPEPFGHDIRGGGGGTYAPNDKPGSVVIEFAKQETDMVNHPQHYTSEAGMEVIDVIEAFTSDLNGIESFDTGNVIKYICRWKHKNGLEDLKKAQWYLNHLIAHVEKM